MATSNTAPRCMVVTPHHLATQSAVGILREGGTAIEATIAAAATLSVVYPHMNGIGGDGFWLIIPPNGNPIAIEACGSAGSLANLEFFKDFNEIPYRGPKSAITVAGVVKGWQEALNYVEECGYHKLATSKLLADAIEYAENGFTITASHERDLRDLISSNTVSSDFKRIFLPNGKVPKIGEIFCQKTLAETLKSLAENGFNSFYKGKLAKFITEDMKYLGMPITETDLSNCRCVRKSPISLVHSKGELLNLPPPTQGIVSLSILGIVDKMRIDGKNEGEFIHATVEATKQAFELRDKYITDPAYMTTAFPNFLIANDHLCRMAKNIDMNKASAKGKGKGPSDTVWLGVMDKKGYSVSYIQSIYHKFGSGVVLPQTGILWQNRGVAFNLIRDHILCLKPGKKPFHTLNPAAARLNDGRVMVYGTRGGDGQPQTQAAVFHRYVIQDMGLQASLSSPRWCYGRNEGNKHDNLKLEDRFSEETVNYLKERGHTIEMTSPYSDVMGHAGVIVRHTDGMMEGAFDPRSDGGAAGF